MYLQVEFILLFVRGCKQSSLEHVWTNFFFPEYMYTIGYLVDRAS